jgi:hypothetical protein
VKRKKWGRVKEFGPGQKRRTVRSLAEEISFAARHLDDPVDEVTKFSRQLNQQLRPWWIK